MGLRRELTVALYNPYKIKSHSPNYKRDRISWTRKEEALQLCTLLFLAGER